MWHEHLWYKSCSESLWSCACQQEQSADSELDWHWAGERLKSQTSWSP